MSTLTNYLENPLWKGLYKRGLYGQPQVNANYHQPSYGDQAYRPTVTHSGQVFAVQYDRSGHSTQSYNTAYLNPTVHKKKHHRLETCTDMTGNPDLCETVIDGPRFYHGRKYQTQKYL